MKTRRQKQLLSAYAANNNRIGLLQITVLLVTVCILLFASQSVRIRACALPGDAPFDCPNNNPDAPNGDAGPDDDDGRPKPCEDTAVMAAAMEVRAEALALAASPLVAEAGQNREAEILCV